MTLPPLIVVNGIKPVAATFGVHLVDWFACDDEFFRSARCRVPIVGDQPEWWDVPAMAKGLRHSDNPRGVLTKLW